MSALKAVCIDCADPASLARWWAPVLGYHVRDYTDGDLADLRRRGFAGPEDDPEVALDPDDGTGPTVWFNCVPEPKAVKNRVHIDVYGSVDELVARGATVVDPQPEGIDWTVMLDPEGNEFCVFLAPPANE